MRLFRDESGGFLRTPILKNGVRNSRSIYHTDLPPNAAVFRDLEISEL